MSTDTAADRRPRSRFVGVAVLAAVTAVALAAAGAPSAQAGPPTGGRLWVSTSGNDANACTAALPCRTFAGAVAKSNWGGTVNVLNSGEYGEVSVGAGKAVTIDGTGVTAAITATGSGNGVTVQPGQQNTVVLRNLTISCATAQSCSGIRVLSGDLVMENLYIFETGWGLLVDTNNADRESHVLIRNTTFASAMSAIGILPDAGATVGVTADGLTIHHSPSDAIRVGLGGTLKLSRSILTDNGYIFDQDKAGLIKDAGGNIFDRNSKQGRLNVPALPLGATQFVGPKQKPIGLKFSPSVPVSATAVIKAGSKTIATIKQNLKAADTAIAWNAKKGTSYVGAGTYPVTVTFKTADGQTSTFTGSIKLT